MSTVVYITGCDRDDMAAISPVSTIHIAIARAMVIFSTVDMPILCLSPSLTGAPVGDPVIMGGLVVTPDVGRGVVKGGSVGTPEVLVGSGESVVVVFMVVCHVTEKKDQVSRARFRWVVAALRTVLRLVVLFFGLVYGANWARRPASAFHRRRAASCAALNRMR